MELKKLEEQDKARKAKEEAERKVAQEQQRREAEAAEQTAWDMAKQNNSQAAYHGYISNYPQGRYASLAKIAQQKLQQEEALRAQQEAQRLQRKQQQAAIRQEDETWAKAKEAPDSQAVNNYINTYPQGRYVAIAKIKLQEPASVVKKIIF